MGAFSDYAEQALLDHILGTSALTQPTVYVALSSTAPNENGSNVTEPTFTGYARQQAAFGAASQSGSGPAEAANDSELAFGDPDEDGSITHVALFDAASGGNMLVYQALDAQVNYQASANDPLSFPVGSLKITLD